jgi:uncharacterized coiled-coil DUF342 family protein
MTARGRRRMGDGSTPNVCSLLANQIAEMHETIARIVRRAVDLRKNLEPLEREPKPDLVEMERVRQELVDVISQLAAAKESLVALEHDYNIAGCPTMG